MMEGGPARLWFYPKAGGSPIQVPVLPVSLVGGLHCWHGDELLFSNTSVLVPPGWYEWKPGLVKPCPTALRMTSPANFDDIEVVREFATSRDGTKIPISILRKKSIRLDGRKPTLLTGYGGYGICLTPAFSSTRRIWFDAGGVYAVANLRGGGEFGDDRRWNVEFVKTSRELRLQNFVPRGTKFCK